jgi:hypothetical protein
MKNSIPTIALIFLGLVLGCGNQTSTTNNPASPANAVQSAPAEKPIAVQSKALTKEYDSNELAADGKYKDKMLAVSGKVSDIAETFGNVTVSLEGHDIVKSVMCNFEESEKANVAKLKKGQTATLIGKGDGMTGGLYVGLQKCKIQ